MVAVWSDDDFEATEGCVTSATFEGDIVATDRGAPTSFVEDGLIVKAGEVVGEILEAVFDVIGEIEAEFGMEAFEIFVVERLGGFGRGFFVASALATFDRFGETLLEVHDFVSQMSREVKFA